LIHRVFLSKQPFYVEIPNFYLWQAQQYRPVGNNSKKTLSKEETYAFKQASKPASQPAVLLLLC